MPLFSLILGEGFNTFKTQFSHPESEAIEVMIPKLMEFRLCKVPSTGLGTPCVNEIKYEETRPKYKKFKCKR